MTRIIKIVKPGADISSQNPGDWLFHSNFAMLKYHSDTQHTMTIDNGDLTKSISFAHGLGYVPKFKAYIENSGFITPLPSRLIEPFTTDDKHFYSYADATNITIGFKTNIPFGQMSVYVNTDYNSGGLNYAFIGNASGSSRDSGIQFLPVALVKDESIESAIIDFKSSDSGDTGTADVKMNIWGIDVDDLTDFGSDLGQPKTTATHSQSQSHLSDGARFNITVTDELREIIGRAGWSSGNNLGFYIFNNGTSSVGNNYVSDYPDQDIVLKIIKSGSQDYNFRVLVFKDKIHD